MRTKKYSSKKMRKKTLKISSHTFCQKLSAFILQGVTEKINFSEKHGFMNKNDAILGVLPFLHMNIKEKTFKRMLDNSEESLVKVLSNRCIKKGLNEKLKTVKYDCKKQSSAGVKVLNDSIIDSIKNRYYFRKNGIKQSSFMAKCMKTQYELGIIPRSSLNWFMKK